MSPKTASSSQHHHRIPSSSSSILVVVCEGLTAYGLCLSSSLFCRITEIPFYAHKLTVCCLGQLINLSLIRLFIYIYTNGSNNCRCSSSTINGHKSFSVLSEVEGKKTFLCPFLENQIIEGHIEELFSFIISKLGALIESFVSRRRGPLSIGGDAAASCAVN